MRRSQIVKMPQFFDRYINLVEDERIEFVLRKSLEDLYQIDQVLLQNIGTKVYAPGKWTVNDILQHLIDNERIQAYRALRFARGDSQDLPGYDEAFFAANTNANERSIKDLIDELILVRQSSIILFSNFNEKQLQSSGCANGIEISALALGFVLVGHQIHHFNVIKERYLPLATVMV